MGNEDLDQNAKIHHVKTLQGLITSKLDVITANIQEMRQENSNYVTNSQLRAELEIQKLKLEKVVDDKLKPFSVMKTQFKIVWVILGFLSGIVGTYVVNLVLNVLKPHG